jgi:Tfp pilus assembly protein PilN
MITVIEIGPGRLSAVVARMNGRGPEIVRQASTELSALEPGAVKAAIEKCGGAAGRSVLLVPRGRVVLRDLELPEGSPDELVAMVRFQVEREMPLPLDQVRYSYIETGRSEGKVRVQVAAVPRELLDPAVTAVEAAGMKVAGAYVSSFGLLSLYGNEVPAALVEVAAGEAEILVTSKGRMELSRTAPLEEGFSPQDIAQEIRRTLLTYGSRSPAQEIQKIVLAGEGQDADELASEVGKHLQRDVKAVGPGSLRTATAAGVCAGLLRGTAMPDLLHPPVVVRKFQLTRRHRIGALAAGILILLFTWSQVALASKRSDLDKKRQQLSALQPRAAALTKTIQETQRADQWYKTRNVWIDVLTSLRQNMSTSNLWIVTASFDDPGFIRIQGKARDDNHVTDFVTALKNSKKFATVAIERIDLNKGEKPEYKKDFTLNAVIAGVDPKKKKN